MLLLFSVAAVGFIISDATLYSIAGPVGKKAVALKRALKIHITHPANTTVISAKSFWKELSRGTAFSNAPRVVLEIPEELRKQFSKTRNIEPARKATKPTSVSEPEKAPEPDTKPKLAVQTGKKTPVKADLNGNVAHKEGLRHYKGDGVPRDFRIAHSWIKKAAAKGHVAAQYNLGIMAFAGQGMKVNLPAAVDWFRRAANQDYAPAQYNLGFMFYQGKGLKKDDVQAYTWMNRAADLGYEKAKKARDLIARVIPISVAHDLTN